jgi:hypothetical protein
MQRFKTDIKCGEADFKVLCVSQLIQLIREKEVRSIIYYLEKKKFGVIDEGPETTPELSKEELAWN